MLKINPPEMRTCWSCKKQARDQMVYYETTTVKAFVCQNCLYQFTMCDRCQMEIPPEQLHFTVNAYKMLDPEQVCATCFDSSLDIDVSSNVRAVY